MAKITFKIGVESTTVDAAIGETLLDVAKNNNIKLFGGCDGAGVCGTCHVFIDKDFIEKLNEASLEETDLLEILPNGKMNSRLACQVIVTEDLDGLVVTIPS